jgi:putative flavoprotein involved in K+ transport
MASIQMTEMRSSPHGKAESGAVLAGWLARLEDALAAADPEAAVELFCEEECFWRDLVAFTWNIATMDGRPAIREMLESRPRGSLTARFVRDGDAQVVDGMVEGWFDFETPLARGRGHARLRDGLCWTLLTAMTELKGHEEPSGFRRPYGVVHQARRGGWPTWLDERERTARSLGVEEQPYCLIVGGGQCGLMLGARLKRLGVPTLIIDAQPAIGGSWRRRYRSLYLHDAVWMDHFPYMPFPDHWPVYMSKDKLADWLEIYAKAMELDVWSSASCREARFDEEQGAWRVAVERDGRRLELRPRHLVLATGLSGLPQTPAIAGAERFEGHQLHSSEYRNGAGLEGKACVVVGANNSAHDIAVDLWERGASVTMIQRSPTTVVKATSLRRHRDKGPLSEAAARRGIDAARADLIIASTPYRAKERLDQADCRRLQEEDAEFYARLRASGFLLDFGEDETGHVGKYMRRASGYYIDVGGSELVASGEIKVRSGVGVAEIRPRSVVLGDGSELAADAIIYATGFGPMEGWTVALISPEAAAKVGRCWGLGSDTGLDPGPWEGELRNMWKPTAQEGLWFMGGNLAQARFHSLHLALQIKARMEGLPTPIHRPRPIRRRGLGP